MDVSDLYRALEFSHYAERYCDKILSIGLSRNTPFCDLVMDFKVLSAYGIKLVITAPDPNFELERESDIAFQIRSQIASERILPVEENTITQNLRNFWVYEINGQIVSTMRFEEYGDWLEIATFRKTPN